jgi:hypothetical protein
VVDRAGSKVGLLDLRTDGVKWLAGLVLWHGPQWNAAGTRFLMTNQAPGGPDTVLVVDAATAAVRPLEGSKTSTDGAEPMCWFVHDTQVGTWTGSGWRMYDPTTGGALASGGTMPYIAANTDVSPDGRFLVSRPTAGGDPVLLDAATGRVLAELPPVYPGRSYWAGTDRLLLLDGQNHVVEEVDLTGKIVASHPLPSALAADEGHNYSLILS